MCKIKDSFSLFLLLWPHLEVESRLHQAKAFQLVFCAVEDYAQCLALFSPTNKVQGDIRAVAAVRRVLLSVSICVALGECVAHQYPGVCV